MEDLKNKKNYINMRNRNLNYQIIKDIMFISCIFFKVIIKIYIIYSYKYIKRGHDNHVITLTENADDVTWTEKKNETPKIKRTEFSVKQG